MNPNRKTELLVGLFLLVGLVMVGGIILQFGSIRESLQSTYRLKVTFPNAPGVKQGSPVFLGGSRIGKVRTTPMLKPDSSGVVLELEIYADKLVPRDATFSVGTVGLMGDALIEIKIAEKEGPITDFYPTDYADIIEGNKSGGLSGLQETAESAAKKVDVALDDVKAALVDVKAAMKKVNEGALSDQVIGDFRESMEHLKNTMTRVDEKVLDDENATNLKAAINDIKDAASSFKKTATNLEATSAKIGPMVDKLDPAIAKADKVMTSADEALASVKKGAEDFASVARAMRTGNGLIPALLNDPELKNEFSDLISNLKRRGVLFYRDAAAKEAGTEAPAKPSPPPTEARRQLFKR
jgi:phospholipid/cholesterol/gamma-HCH transport system substrate-binding protein